MTMWQCRMMAAALMVVLMTVVDAQSPSECCSTCIGKTALVRDDYDPLVYAQCRSRPNSARICCFDCGTWREPTYGDAVRYAADGTTLVTKAGTWISLQWAAASKVTYIALPVGQNKTATPMLNDTAATVTDGTFTIYAGNNGSIVFRGWGNDSCRQASTEQTIQVLGSTPTNKTSAPVTSSGSLGSSQTVGKITAPDLLATNGSGSAGKTTTQPMATPTPKPSSSTTKSAATNSLSRVATTLVVVTLMGVSLVM